MASIWSGLGSTLGRQFGKRDAIPFLAGAVGALVLLPKFAYSEDDFATSYWIKQYRPELLPQAAEESHAVAAVSPEDKVMAETLGRIKKIETALGIKD